MDKTMKRNVILGLFVMSGIILFIAGIFLIGSRNELFNKTFIITADFSNATGLKSGSNVRFNGVKVGVVNSVTIVSDTMVQVNMKIERSKRNFITNNVVASIASDGLMGDKIVNLITQKGGGIPISDNAVIASTTPLSTDKVLQTLNATNENVKGISDNLLKITQDLNSGRGTIQTLYKDTAMASKLRASFSNLDLTTNQVLSAGNSLREITDEIKNGHGPAGELLKDTLLSNDLIHTMNKLKSTSDQLDDISHQLSQTIQSANTGKGAVNMLLRDTTFANNVQQSMTNIKSASIKLNEDMEALKHNFLTRRYFRKLSKGKHDQQ
jgi:phospholipid/cholesterol/gamma-HCH transport system substrate-binding protein